MTAEGDGPAIIRDHPYVQPSNPYRFLCATCQLAEAAHAETTRPYVPTGRRRG